MVQNVTYQNRIHQEENTPLVTIMETRIDVKQSTAVDARQSAYVIDLTKASFGGISYPKPGTKWYIKKISGVWALMARASQQNPQLGTALIPAVGQTYIGGEGDTHIIGTVQTELGSYTANTATTGDSAFASRINGEAGFRYVMHGDGTHLWNDGTSPGVWDVSLYRGGAGVLQTNSTFIAPVAKFGGSSGNAVFIGDDAILVDINHANAFGIQGQQDATQGGIWFGSGFDTNLYRAAAGVLETGSAFRGRGAVVSNDVFYTIANGDANNRFAMHADGSQYWNDGTSPGVWDVSLARSSAATLTLSGNLTVTGNVSSYPNAIGFTVVSPSISTTSTTFADMSGITFTFTKEKASTRVRLAMSLSWYISNGASNVDMAININGTDYTIIKSYATNNTGRMHSAGFVYVTGLGAGNYTVKGRWKINAGVTLNSDNNDVLCIEAMECK